MTAPTEGAAYDRRWWTLAVLCISLMVISVDNTILNVALPSIVSDLHAQGSQLQWIIDAYTIVFAGLLLTAGSLGDRLGRKGALTAGLALFAVCSAIASRATSPNMLIASRGLMGIGGAFIFPTTLSILTNTFVGRERARAIGIWAGVSGLGIVVGPLGGGLLLEHFSWGSVFLVNVPICITAAVLGLIFVPKSRDPGEGRLDPVGAALSIVALSGLLYGIIQGPDAGWSSPAVLGALGGGAAVLALFLYWETHTAYPMLDVRFFRNARFSAASATITLTYFALFGSTFLLTQYFQFVLGYSPLKAGLMTAPVAIGIMVGAPQAPKLVERFDTKRVVVGGLLLVAVALSMYASDTIMSSVVLGGLVRVLFGLGMGFTSAPATESIMGSLPPGKAGVGSAVNDTTRQTGGALGVAVIGSIFALRYHAAVTNIAGVPASVQAQVRDSIGKALVAAQRLPAQQQRLVQGVADNAYVNSMRLAFAVATGVILVAAFVSWRWLPARAPADPVNVDEAELAEATEGAHP
ncbi:MAG: drug resistance transporter, EmrB/QacA subfamily [Acidimicrobiales bacterium]|nr:drug resistance transporter, EmrB/QacA subfamily [Acidimicrobiales bacterium]